LQEFIPLHSLVAVLHSDVPLQELIPAHFTPESAASADGATMAPVLKMAAAAAAIAIPEVVFMV
jgi:hypothetical protein